MKRLISIVLGVMLASLVFAANGQQASAGVVAPAIAAEGASAPHDALITKVWGGGGWGRGGWGRGPGWRGYGWRGYGWHGGWRPNYRWRPGWGWGPWPLVPGPYYYGPGPYYGAEPYYPPRPCCDEARPYYGPGPGEFAPPEPPLK